MGMSDKMRKEMMMKRDFVNALVEGLKEDGNDAFVTGDGSFAVIMEIEGVDRVLNFAGTMKKNLIDGVEVEAMEVVDNMVMEYDDKINEREERERLAAEKKVLKLAEVARKKAKKAAEDEATKKIEKADEVKGE